uniref:Uncharacterized protein n=1 Tax=Yersinia enterocolitica TaxID=630 RepID=B0RKZ6_YEREN|nr:hypothetical protein [Yersinia enterocolitica]
MRSPNFDSAGANKSILHGFFALFGSDNGDDIISLTASKALWVFRYKSEKI